MDTRGSADDAWQRTDVQPPCLIVEDNPAVARFIARALVGFGVASAHCATVPALVAALARTKPKAIFLDIALGDSDAIDAIRALSQAGFTGVVQLMSGSNTGLLGDVRQVGERHGLRMRPVLTKPFRIEAIKHLVEEEGLGSVPTIIAAEPASPDSDAAIRSAPAPEVALREALDRNWVEFWYQPKVNLITGQMVGAEGLARVRHPELGLLAPGSFIPNASGPDLIALA